MSGGSAGFSDSRIKKKVWSFHESLYVFLIMAFLSGLHYGILLLSEQFEYSTIMKILYLITYWAIVSAIFSLVTHRQIRKKYDGPVEELGKAAHEVASGDFSVYLNPRHTEDKLDYIDVMYLDFNKMVEELGSLETMKTEFFSNVSHEMKTPLAVMSSSIELMQSGKLSEEEFERQLDTVSLAAKRMNSLISNLLRLNKLEKQTIVPKTESYDLCEQLCECVITFEHFIEEKGIDFEAELEDSVLVEADEELMSVVWNNIMSNALKFTPEGGSITLREATEDGFAVVSVSDTGCGMNEETMGHIFDKFYQGDTSHATEGNGLGLALVWRILQLSGASIAVESREGEGSVFTIRIPVSGEGGDQRSAQDYRL